MFTSLVTERCGKDGPRMDKNNVISLEVGKHDLKPGDKVILNGILIDSGPPVYGLVATVGDSYSIEDGRVTKTNG